MRPDTIGCTRFGFKMPVPNTSYSKSPSEVEMVNFDSTRPSCCGRKMIVKVVFLPGSTSVALNGEEWNCGL